jgi:SAM-dependent methyltransferase
MSLANTIKQHTPWPIRRLSRRIKRGIRQRRDAKLSCREVFTRIYETNAWGGKPGELYSGPGSAEAAAKPYVDAVASFIRERDIRSVVDLGCGDFRVGQAIAPSVASYTGIDIVESVIARNRQRHGGGNVQFLVKDIIEDDLPQADLCLIREVFQHLSNAQIQRVLPKLRAFRYVIVTDHQPPPGKITPNLDKPHGQFIRIYNQSALFLDKPPFNVENVELFLDIKAPSHLYDEDERLRSFLIRINPAASAAA